jgi:GGDEF domain-containing protein
VADLSLDAALERADEIAQRWAIALVLARPLGRIGDIPLEQLACEAPALCAQALRALQSDAELDRLTGGAAPTGRAQSAPALRLAAIAGAGDAAAVVEAVEALRGVLWETLLEELRPSAFQRTYARQVADLADRLAYVCARALKASIAATAALAPDVTLGEPDAAPELPERGAHRGERGSASGPRAVIVDERRDGAAPTRASVFEREPIAPAVCRRSRRPSSWDESPPVPPGASAGEIAIRDERGEEGPVAWIRSIGSQLEHFELDALPFAVLLVELLNVEQLRRSETPGELSRLLALVEETLTRELGPWSGSLTRESPGRYWLLVPQTDQSAAARLRERLARAVQALRAHRGELLRVAIGTAVCPDHGREAAALAAHADVGLCAARSGVRATLSRSVAQADELA